MARPLQSFVIFVLFQFLFFSNIVILSEANEDSDLMELGNHALAAGKYEAAEDFFEKVLEVQPGNYLATRELAEVKIKLNKLNEALSLLNDLLKLPVAKGRDILVYMDGDPNPLSAELVDETVMVIDKFAQQDNNDFGKFLKSGLAESVPHYRVYFKKTGKMKLLPKSKNRIKYFGIPAATREKIMVLKSQVKKNLISSINVEPEEEMVSIKAGCFQMGSKVGDSDELPVHEVCISSFKLSKYEVKQKNFQAIMKVNPSENVGADHPVDSVSWLDARRYCKKLGLRLPSEAEWEYAARGGKQTEFYWGNRVTGREGNFCDSTCEMNIREPRVSDGFRHTAPVGSFPPNPFGLHDMSGNVSEWVQDWFDIDKKYYMVSPKKDPPGARPELDTCAGTCAGAASITNKIYRGGAWNQSVSEMRSANRKESHFQLQAAGNGFRCASN
jgi:formylglycine-generating enzyme required for sulfatase activity